MKTGIELILEERKRQLEVLGYDSTDPEMAHYYSKGELVDASLVYLGFSVAGWPESWGNTYKPKNKIRDLVKAAAMLAAEIDRLQAIGE